MKTGRQSRGRERLEEGSRWLLLTDWLRKSSRKRHWRRDQNDKKNHAPQEPGAAGDLPSKGLKANARLEQGEFAKEQKGQVTGA